MTTIACHTTTIKFQEPVARRLVTSRLVTAVILIAVAPLGKLVGMVWKFQRPSQRARAPRIRVPNRERALFIVGTARFVGVIQRLSLTGGSAVLSKGPIPHGTIGDISLSTVFGRVDAKIEFLQTGADGVAHAQAFRFIVMDDTSSDRFVAAARQMIQAGLSDDPKEGDFARNPEF